MAPAKSENREDRDAIRVRRYRSRGVEVEIGEAEDAVELTLDGHPIKVAYLDGKYSSQTANMFRTYDSVEEIVDELLANEGRTWTLHGGPDDDHDHDHEHDEDHPHDHGPDRAGGQGGGHR
jgi:hypothetical protein